VEDKKQTMEQEKNTLLVVQLCLNVKLVRLNVKKAAKDQTLKGIGYKFLNELYD
jgi:hypothetical protein